MTRKLKMQERVCQVGPTIECDYTLFKGQIVLP